MTLSGLGNLTVYGDTTITGGELYLSNTAASNMIIMNTYGSGLPTITTARSLGSKIVLGSTFSSTTQTDYAIGIDYTSTVLWHSVPQNSATYGFQWYGGQTNLMSLDGAGILTLNYSSVSSSSTTGTLRLAGGLGINYSGDASSSTNGGSFTTAGGAAIAKKLYVGGATYLSSTISISGITSMTNSTTSTSASTGALVLTGGLGINNSTDATSATNGGSFTTSGGAAIAKTLYVGGIEYIAGGTLNFTNATSNMILMPAATSGYPTFTTRSVGTALVLYPDVTASSADTAIGNNGRNMWFSVPTASASYLFRWYGGTTLAMNLDGVGNLTIYGSTNINSTTASTSPSTGGLVLSGGLGINNVTDATSATNGGSLTTAGGAAIAKTLYVGGNANLAGGVLNLTNGTSNMIALSNFGLSAPTFTSRSVGTNFLLWSVLSATTVDFAVGMETNAMWYSIPQNSATYSFKWYGGTTSMMELSNGNLSVTGDITVFASVSDRRLKTDIKNIQSTFSLDTVVKLRPVEFTWKKDIFNKEKRGKHDIGFIAQEIDELIPEAVGDYTDLNDKTATYKCIKYERIIPHLVGAIQQLTNEIRMLQNTVESLNEKVMWM